MASSAIIERFKALGEKPFAAQAKWYINAYWEKIFKGEANAGNREQLFKAFSIICGLSDDGRNGNSVGQWKAHQFLEKADAAITWEKFKLRFGRMDIDVNNRLSLVEYLLFRFDGDVKFLVNAPQKVLPGLEEAEEILEKSRLAHEECVRQKEAAAALHKQILEFKERFDAISEKFQKKIDTATSLVKRNMAVAQLNAHKSGARARRKGITELDPEKLHTLEIKQGAAVRKQRAAARKAKKALQKAEEKVAVLKASATSGEGLMWWLERELEDAKKSMSQKDYERKKVKLAKKKANRARKLCAASPRRRPSLTAGTA